MKRILLTLLIIAGFIITASAQNGQNRMVRPRPDMDRKIDRMELRRLRMERRRHHWRRHHRIAAELNPTDLQKLQAVLYDPGEKITC